MFHANYIVYQGLQFGKNKARPFSSLKYFSWLGIIINSQWYEEKWLVNYLLKIILKMQGMNPMGLSAPWADFIDILSLHPVKILSGINPMGLSAPW